jgi:hypothetical protein
METAANAAEIGVQERPAWRAAGGGPSLVQSHTQRWRRGRLKIATYLFTAACLR